jgi:DNA primase
VQQRPTIEEVKRSLPSLETLADCEGGESRPCPFHEDSNPSMRVYKNGSFHCFGCGADGDVLDWIGYQQYGQGYTKRGDQLAHVIDLVAAQGVTPLTPSERADRIERATTPDVAAIRQRLWLEAHQAHNRLQAAHRAVWRDWGISDEVQDAHLLGWDGQRLTIPALYRGVCFGIKRRLMPGAAGEAKYITAPDSKWGGYAFDPLASYSYAVVTEDEKSALALLSQGVNAISTTGGAGFWKSRKADWWERPLYGVPTLVYWRDADEPGLQSAIDFRARFPRAGIVDSAPYKDAADFLAASLDWREILLPDLEEVAVS